MKISRSMSGEAKGALHCARLTNDLFTHFSNLKGAPARSMLALWRWSLVKQPTGVAPLHFHAFNA